MAWQAMRTSRASNSSYDDFEDGFQVMGMTRVLIASPLFLYSLLTSLPCSLPRSLPNTLPCSLPCSLPPVLPSLHSSLMTRVMMMSRVP